MIDIAMDGPVIEGTWCNPQTGDCFTVRDSYFQDNQLLISATDGRVFDYNTIQNYIKSDKPIAKQPKPTKPAIPANIESMLENPMGEEGILEEDLALIRGQRQQPATQPATQPQAPLGLVQAPAQSEDEIIINRILSRVELPQLDVKVVWNKFPMKQLDMLIDMMGVEVEDISNYFINKMSVDDIRKLFKEQLTTYIEKTFSATTTPTVHVEEKSKVNSKNHRSTRKK